PWTPLWKPARARPHQHEGDQQTTSKARVGACCPEERAPPESSRCAPAENLSAKGGGDWQAVRRTAPGKRAGVEGFLGKLRWRPLDCWHLAEPLSPEPHNDQQEPRSTVETP